MSEPVAGFVPWATWATWAQMARAPREQAREVLQQRGGLGVLLLTAGWSCRLH